VTGASLTDLISVQEAISKILADFSPLPVEIIPLEKSLRRVLAEDVHAPFDLPLFTNSSVDGFAVCAAEDVRAGSSGVFQMPVVGDIPAGAQPAFKLLKGQTARIMTGAPLPSGADAVLPVEDTNFPYRSPATPLPAQITFFRFPRPDENVRPRGQDLKSGDRLLKQGRILQPQDIGMLASLGQAQVSVFRQPHLALFSSGDELLPPGAIYSPGKIFDSNSYTLSMLAQRGNVRITTLGVAADRYEDVLQLFNTAVSLSSDLILTSAGVSVGTHDYVRQVIEDKGHLKFWRVNIRPGKPLTYGNFQGVPVLSLPGNPVSAFIGFLVFVRPLLAKMSGLTDFNLPTVQVQLQHPVLSDGRESYLRAVVHRTSNQLTARLTGHQGSGNLFSLVQANALLIVPAGVKSLPAGAVVQAWLMDDDPLPVVEKPE
jgi:molybdopterin molybdotransferase